MENLPSLHSRAHDGFCNRCRPIEKEEVSAEKLREYEYFTFWDTLTVRIR